MVDPDPYVLDCAHLRRQSSGDLDLERDLLRLLEGQCRRLAPVLAGGAPSRERADAAHTLKGAARAVGAWALADVAAEVEEAATREPATDPSPDLLQRLERAVRDFQAAASALGPAE